MRRNSSKKKKKAGRADVSMSGAKKLSLAGFKSVEWPPVLPVRLKYTDYRVLSAVGNEVTYVYRLNSCFDCDFTGAGGQPEGFDQLKAQYTQYRVVAAKVSVEGMGNGANTNGLIAMGPSNSSTYVTNIDAESLANGWGGKSATYSQTTPGKLKALYRIGELEGYNEDSLLANVNMAADVGASPSFQQFLGIAVETGNSATGQTMVRVEIEYYVRMELRINTEDAATRRRKAAKVQWRLASGLPVPTATGPTTNLPSTSLPSNPPSQRCDALPVSGPPQGGRPAAGSSERPGSTETQDIQHPARAPMSVGGIEQLTTSVETRTTCCVECGVPLARGDTQQCVLAGLPKTW